MPENITEPSAILPGAVEDAHHRIGRHRLAGAGLADDGERLALGDGDVDVLHRFHDAAAGGEFDGEVLDVEQGLGGHEGLPIKNAENNPMHSRMGLELLENFWR